VENALERLRFQKHGPAVRSRLSRDAAILAIGAHHQADEGAGDHAFRLGASRMMTGEAVREWAA
jgi:hypothetical protein